jgi:predicted nicotinamide N-methyase
MDYEPEALRYARLNESLNGISGVTWASLDWRKACPFPESVDCLWAGDIMYERSFALPVATFIARALTPDGVAWLAEPGRELFRLLLPELLRHGLSYVKIRSVPTWPILPQAVPVPVTIWEITHAS